MGVDYSGTPCRVGSELKVTMGNSGDDDDNYNNDDDDDDDDAMMAKNVYDDDEDDNIVDTGGVTGESLGGRATPWPAAIHCVTVTL